MDASQFRKPRSDSKLDALDLDQQRLLCEWLLTPGLSYEVIKRQVFETFNVSCSAASLSAFYRSYCSVYLVQRRRAAVGVASELAEEAKLQPGTFDAAAIDALQQKAFEFANNPMVDPKDVKAIFSLVLKAKDQELTERRIKILEAKAQQADEAAETMGNAALTPEQKTRRMKEIFGIA